MPVRAGGAQFYIDHGQNVHIDRAIHACWDSRPKRRGLTPKRVFCMRRAVQPNTVMGQQFARHG